MSLGGDKDFYIQFGALLNDVHSIKEGMEDMNAKLTTVCAKISTVNERVDQAVGKENDPDRLTHKTLSEAVSNANDWATWRRRAVAAIMVLPFAGGAAGGAGVTGIQKFIASLFTGTTGS